MFGQVSGGEEQSLMLDVRMELSDSRIDWTPDLGAEGGTGVQGMLEGWMKTMQGVGSVVQRLDADEGMCPSTIRQPRTLPTYTDLGHAQVHVRADGFI